MASKDPYDILGVSRNATPDEIKRAYRRLAKKHHPDHNPNDKQAEQRFKEVQAAYEVLGDSDRRAQFDRFGAGGPAPDVHTWTSGRGGPFEDVRVDFGSLGDLTSIFELFFSRGAARGRTPRPPRRPAARGADIEHTVDLTFEEALHGTTRTVVLAAEGARDSARIEFRVPAGVADGQRVRVRGQGQPGAGGRGDLIIRCHVQPHPHFRREGLDILLDLPLSLAEAALGARVDIPTLAGPTVLTVPPGTSSGTKLRLRGRGVQDERTGQTGDMYAIIRVVVPRELSPRARELVQALQQELKQSPRVGGTWPP
jgi:curved DNA-binding protein